MLQVIHNFSKSWLVKAFLILLILSFGIWGVGDMFRGNPQQRPALEIGPVKITSQEIERAFQNSLPEARRIFGPQLTTQEARQLGLIDRAVNILVETNLFELEAKRLGINPSDATIFKNIAARPELRDEAGNFRKDVWQQFIRHSGITEKMLIDEDRRVQQRRLLVDSIAPTTRPIPASLVIDNLYRALGQKRIFEIVSLDHNALKLPAPPADEILQKFYDGNADQFARPERRTLTIASLAIADLQDEIKPSDEELQAAYTARAGEFLHPEQRDLLQVVLPSEAAAKKLAEAAKEKGGLKAAAKSQGLELVTLNRVEEATILPELFTTVFALKDGAVTEPLKTDLGWHVVQQVTTYPPGQTPFSEVKDKLRDSIKQEKAGDQFAAAAAKLEDALAAGQSLDEMADSMRLRLVKTPPLDTKGLAADGKAPAELPAFDQVLTEAFTLQSGETSGVIDDRKGTYYIVHVDQVTLRETPSLDSIKPEVISAWQNQERKRLAGEETTKIAEAARNGAKLDSFAKSPGVTLRTSQPVSLLGQDNDKAIPPGALPKILELKQGEVISYGDATAHFVFRLQSLTEADAKADPAARGRLENSYRDQFPYELVEQYSKELRARFPVIRHEEVLNRLKQQEG